MTLSGDTDSSNLVTVPDIRNKTVSEAQKILTDTGFTVKTYCNSDVNNTLVKDQNPKPGSSLTKGSVIIIYGEGNEISTSTVVPDLKGLGASQAMNVLKSKNLNINIQGNGTVVSQDPSTNEQIPEGTIINVTLKQILTDAH